MYGKIENGRLRTFRGRSIVAGGKRIINPTGKILASLGYKPIISEALPEVPPKMAISISYIDEGDHIRQRCELVGGYK